MTGNESLLESTLLFAHHFNITKSTKVLGTFYDIGAWNS